MRQMILATVVVLQCVIGSIGTAAEYMTLIKAPVGAIGIVPQAISDDGSTVVGALLYPPSQPSLGHDPQFEAFRWTRETGVIPLGMLSDNPDSHAFAVSADGSVVVGFSGHAFVQSPRQAFRWTEAAGMVGLDQLPGGNSVAVANGVSGDGTTIVGYSSSSTGVVPVQWLSDQTVIELKGVLGASYLGQAYDVTPDGSVVVGYGSQAFRWTQETGYVVLPGLAPPLATLPRAEHVSADGTVVIGTEYSGSGSDPQGFRWSAADGTIALETSAQFENSFAYGVDHDGSTIVGRVDIGRPEDPNHDVQAFIWDSANGMRLLKSALQMDYGLHLDGWRLGFASDITPDGESIVGYGTDPSGQEGVWIIRVPEPSGIVLFAISSLIALPCMRRMTRRPCAV